MNSTLQLIMPAYPEVFLLIMTSIILMVDLYLPERHRYVTYMLTQFTLLGCAVLTIGMMQATGGQTAFAFNDMFVGDVMSDVLKLVTYISVSAYFAYSRIYMADRNLLTGDFFVLSLFSMLGMMVMISANHLIALHVGLELMSLSLDR